MTECEGQTIILKECTVQYYNADLLSFTLSMYVGVDVECCVLYHTHDKEVECMSFIRDGFFGPPKQPKRLEDFDVTSSKLLQ